MIGEETLQLINKTISSVDQGLQCFNDSKKTAEEAVVRAHKAYNMTVEAEQVKCYSILTCCLVFFSHSRATWLCYMYLFYNLSV